MKAIHFINHREGFGLRGLDRVPDEKNVYMSYSWALPENFMPPLIGGWIYLHDAKSKPSDFGGVIRDIFPSQRIGKAIEEGLTFVFEARKEMRGQKWRGADYSLAWTSGIVEADYEHEIKSVPEPRR